MKLWRILLVLAVAGGCGPGGNGDVVSCTCDVAYIDSSNQLSYMQGSMSISLCESSFATDHSADAEAQCQSLADTADTDNKMMHVCACSCVHLTQRCDMP
jgi:hypothetical protein